jgi:hypothetical protein
MESCSNQKSVKQIQIYLYLILQISTLCLDECNAKHLLAAFTSLCVPTRPKPSQFGLGPVIVEASASDAALHHSPSW